MNTSLLVLFIITSCAKVVSWTTTTASSGHDFCSRYEKRLGLGFSLEEGEPCSSKLRLLTETHLASIPFDNLRLHGAANAPVSMDASVIADQLIDRRRGGVCFELNALFAKLLDQLGYGVTLVNGYMVQANAQDVPHMAILAEDNDGNTWFADVGMGEPPLHPLKFMLDEVQKTPDGMQSRFIACKDVIELQWYLPEKNEWESRFCFDRPGVETGPQRNVCSEDFEPLLLEVLDVGSHFRRKPVACKLTRQEKTTLAGNILKRSQNRFTADATERTYNLQSIEEIRYVLRDEFGIPLDETLGLSVPGIAATRGEYVCR